MRGLTSGKTRDVCSLYVEDYLAATGALGYGDLPRLQKGPFTSLAFGAAGIAYAHWYAGVVLDEERLLEHAERWIRSAILAQRGSAAFLGPTAEPGARMPASAFLYGPAGLYFVRALVAHSRLDRRARRSALARFIELSHLSLAGSPELYAGTAGCLAGAAILSRFTSAPELLETGERLARHLEESLLDRVDASGSASLRRAGLAHGDAGLYLSLLLWSSASGSSLPHRVSDALTEFFEVMLHDPRRLCPRPARVSWLCSGFPGFSLLAVKAYECLERPRFLEAACEAARLALVSAPESPNLCCGRAGVAFACLALSRFDAGGPWRRQAEELTLSTLLVDRDEWPFTGLYNGEAAIPCLVLNILSGSHGGPPCLDLIQPRGVAEPAPLA